ncbi:g2663 [Coccomyxa elongata]
MSSVGPADTILSHHSPDGRFDNPWDTWKETGLWGVLKWQIDRRAKNVPQGGWLLKSRTPTSKDFIDEFPLHQLDSATLSDAGGDFITAVWMGHASVLVKMEGITFLTDPVFSQRCSPVQWAGPKRFVPAPRLDKSILPSLDFVIISHNHYDHLDYGTVVQLHKQYGNDLTWYVPLGLQKWFHRCKITNVKELDWWQSVQHCGGPVTVTMTPAQHWSSRTGTDRRHTLWGGYAVLGEKLRFWFAGDTGYCPVFKEIGRRLGPFDLSAIPIGAYKPRDFMKPQHINPQEAVQIHQDVRSMQSIGIHCCTFCLTDEALDEPPQLLVREAAAAKLSHGSFVTLQHGACLKTAGGLNRNEPALLGTP